MAGPHFIVGVVLFVVTHVHEYNMFASAFLAVLDINSYGGHYLLYLVTIKGSTHDKQKMKL